MINKLIYLSLLLAIGLLPLSASAGADTAPSSASLNVLFIAVDDLRTNLGCYGDPIAHTPHIDGLAKRGVTFTRAYCQQAVCNPSRASVMTGLRPDTIRVWDLDTHFREHCPDVVTLPQYFKSHGYHAQSVGKIYHDPASAQDPPSWSEPETLAITRLSGKYALPSSMPPKGKSKGPATERAPVDDADYIDGKVSEAACELLRENRDRPFFLAVGFRRPHLPFSAPAKYWDIYDRDKLPLPEWTDPPHGAPEVALHDWIELRGYTDVPTSGQLSESKIHELIHGYYAATSYVDAQVGRVLDELDRLGLTSSTVVVLWSDHGFHLGEQGLWCKTTNFELDTRVPLVVSAPNGYLRGEQTSAIVELLDLYPTLTELAGLPPAPGLEGESFATAMRSPAGGKEAALSQFPRPMKRPEVIGYSVRTQTHRYTEWRDIQTSAVVARELYDYAEGLVEKHNLAESPESADPVRRLSGLLSEKVSAVRE